MSTTIGWGDGFRLGDAASYALIAFHPHNFQGTADSPIHGWVGVGSYSGIQLANDKIYGGLVTTGKPPSHTGGTVTQGVHGYASQLSADIQGLQCLSDAAASEHGTCITFHNGQTVNALNGTWDSHGNVVFTATNWADNVTLCGPSWEHVIINVGKGINFKLDNLHLTGGLKADQVLINYTGTAELHGVNGDTFQGTVLVPDAKVNVDGVHLDGHLFGGACGDDFQWVSNATVCAPPCEPPPCLEQWGSSQSVNSAFHALTTADHASVLASDFSAVPHTYDLGHL